MIATWIKQEWPFFENEKGVTWPTEILLSRGVTISNDEIRDDDGDPIKLLRTVDCPTTVARQAVRHLYVLCNCIPHSVALELCRRYNLDFLVYLNDWRSVRAEEAIDDAKDFDNEMVCWDRIARNPS